MRSKTRLTCLVFATVLMTSALAAQTTPTYPLWHDLEPGKHAVGFQLLHVATAAEGEKRRAVRIGLWYPASAPPDSQTMVHGNYVEISPSATLDPKLETFLNESDRESQGRQFFDANADRHQESLENTNVAAIHNAKIDSGPYPLVLHSLGRNGNLFQHTILWEYLASHGFVVATVAQHGKSLDDPWMDFDVDDLKIQLDDLRITLDHFRSQSFVDSSKIGVMGHSSGAVVGLWLAAEQPDVKAVVGLDGSINRREGKEVFKAGLEKKTVAAPFLNICRWPHDEYDDGFMRHLKGDIVRIGFEKGIHFDFQNWPAYQAFAQATEPSSLAVRSLDEAKNLFVATARFTRLFLNQHLLDDAEAGARLRDKTVELSSGQASIQILP
ncbi:MAG: prolyl oligopeptidase family serine peptidase [Acidobacteriota bacterium]